MTRWLLCCAILTCACGSETEGQTIRVRWVVGSANEGSGNREFVTDTGWQVSLEEAQLAVESVFAIAPDADGIGALAKTLGHWLVPVAHAHGGYDAAGGQRVRAEWLGPAALDALNDGERSLGTFGGEAGAIASVKIEIARASSQLPESLQGQQAYVRGHAEREGRRLEFAGKLTVADSEPARRIEIPAQFSLSDGGTLSLRIHTLEWFRQAEFDRLAGEDSEEPIPIEPESQVGRAWAIGIRSPAAFSLQWEAKTRE